MADIPKEEILEELEAIRLAIMNLEQFVVPSIEESEARRKVEKLIDLLRLANL
jgi:hypothetical protein